MNAAHRRLRLGPRRPHGRPRDRCAPSRTSRSSTSATRRAARTVPRPRRGAPLRARDRHVARRHAASSSSSSRATPRPPPASRSRSGPSTCRSIGVVEPGARAAVMATAQPPGRRHRHGRHHRVGRVQPTRCARSTPASRSSRRRHRGSSTSSRRACGAGQGRSRTCSPTRPTSSSGRRSTRSRATTSTRSSAAASTRSCSAARTSRCSRRRSSRSSGRGVRLISSAEETAREVAETLERRGPARGRGRPGRLAFATTGDAEEFERLGSRVFGRADRRSSTRVELVELAALPER